MFHHMLAKNPPVQEEFKRWKISDKEYREFIEELIMGEPGENAKQVSTLLHMVTVY